jgi:hypothetical protein
VINLSEKPRITMGNGLDMEDANINF